MEQTEKLYHRFKVGRPRHFETPEDLWLAALEYFAWCDANPYKVSMKDRRREKRGDKAERSAEKMYEEVPRPYTLDGLHLFLNMHTPWKVFKENVSRRKDAEAFNTVICACEECVRNQQVGGAMIGLYSERLTARLNGISDKVEVDQRNTTMAWEDFQKLLNGEKISV